MAKKRIRITVGGETLSAPIFEIENMSWKETELGCPYCGLFSQIKPIVDVIQIGLLDHDNVHTVAECRYCSNKFALHYHNTYEVTE